MERDAETRQVLSVHVDFKGNRFDLKYHLFRGQWELRNANRKRSVLGRSDFILNNDVSFRLRAVTREKISKKEAADIIRYLNISIPDNGDFYRTDVTLRNTATTGIQIDSFEAKSKVHVEANGLCFCISYLDLRQDGFRLECRLLKLETAKLDDEDNEAQVLLKKVLQMLEYKP
ncbi:unnamed protein product [Peronospora belbahrii]|uniref:CYTH domain-containing protein n=1 Tax=Peronospora belbahrii TaxID=622444 RepID=A0ABN8CUB0_9STRA|nr:unnamed protein product [Peronospora belbahrii]